MAAGTLRIFVVMLQLLLLLFNRSIQERTLKASKSSLEQIKQLFNQKAAQRAFVQNDAAVLADEPRGVFGLRRDPMARRHHDELAVNDPDGDYLQGDLELAEWQAERLRHKLGKSDTKEATTKRRRRKRKIGREPFYKRWDRRRPISYDMAENVPEKTRQKIRHALAIWQNATCLRFVEGGPDTDRFEFFDGGGCSSFVGRAGGTQGISIATPGCDLVGIIAHEVGHALGIFHEQARPDQSQHIAVHYNNIPALRWNNFQPIGDDQAATLGLPYDAGSVMHYGPYGFAADQFRPTISTLDKHWLFTIGQREGPSFLDFESINRAYGCVDQCSIALNCLHGGYADPNGGCHRCVCPMGFSGTFCNNVQRSACGGAIEVSPTVKTVASPEYPGGNFPPDLDCVWLFRAPPRGHVFVQFDDEPFGYPCEDTCDGAFVELKTGPDFRVTGYRFCCSTPPSMAFRSVGEEAVLFHFGGSQSAGHRGFRARVWSDQKWPTTEGETLISGGGRSTTTTDPKWGNTVVVEVDGGAELSSISSSTTTPMASSGSSARNHTTTVWVEQTITASVPMPISSPPPPSPSSIDCSACQQWSEWGECSQMCGGCGRKTRRRLCPPAAQCQIEEKRMCNRMACPGGTNFLFNNGEFHLLWKGCCVGLFLVHNTTAKGDGLGECGPLENNENAFLRIISSLLSSHDEVANGTTTKTRGNGRRRGKTTKEHRQNDDRTEEHRQNGDRMATE